MLTQRPTPNAQRPYSQRPSRLVVKVGTSTLTDEEGKLDRAFIADLTAQLATLKREGADVVLVTSGAIRAGREALGDSGFAETETLPYKQAAAAVGQGLLQRLYTEAFAWRKTLCAQVLLTRDDLGDPLRVENARNTLLALLKLSVVPIINENDTVAVEEIKFGDNDTLAARVAVLLNADLLLILSDVEGLYDRSPQEATKISPPKLIRRVENIAEIFDLGGDSVSGMGTGGMRTKLEAARIATEAGIRTVIAKGRRERVALDVAYGEPIGTEFIARMPCLNATEDEPGKDAI